MYPTALCNTGNTANSLGMGFTRSSKDTHSTQRARTKVHTLGLLHHEAVRQTTAPGHPQRFDINPLPSE